MGRLNSFGSIHSNIFLKIDVLKNLTKSTGKTCGRIFNKVSGLHTACGSLEKEAPTQLFFWDICKTLRIPILEHVYMSPKVNSNRFEISLWDKT